MQFSYQFCPIVPGHGESKAWHLLSIIPLDLKLPLFFLRTKAYLALLINLHVSAKNIKWSFLDATRIVVHAQQSTYLAYFKPSTIWNISRYRIVVSINTSRLEAPSTIYRLFMHLMSIFYCDLWRKTWFPN